MDEIRDWVKNHRTIVCLRGSEEDMDNAKRAMSVKYGEFHDEDLDNMLTAIAFWPMTKKDGEGCFESLRLA